MEFIRGTGPVSTCLTHAVCGSPNRVYSTDCIDCKLQALEENHFEKESHLSLKSGDRER